MIQRNHPRRKVLWDAEVRYEDGRLVQCQVLDIAAGGARIRIEGDVPIGSTVNLIVQHLEVAFPGTIQWQRASHAGIGFLEEPSIVELRLAEVMPGKLKAIA